MNLNAIKSYLQEVAGFDLPELTNEDLSTLKEEGKGNYTWYYKNVDNVSDFSFYKYADISTGTNQTKTTFHTRRCSYSNERSSSKETSITARFVKLDDNTIAMIKHHQDIYDVTDYDTGGGYGNTDEKNEVAIFEVPKDFKFTDGLIGIKKIYTQNFKSEEEAEQELNAKLK